MYRLCVRPLAAVFVVWTLVLAGGRLAGEERSAFARALDSIRADQLQRHVDVLADDTFEGREAGTRGNRAAANYIVKHFQEHGLVGGGEDGGYFQSFGSGYRNILGLLPGDDAKLKNEIVIICAHYDHVGYGNQSNSRGPTGYIHNGADDNASGVAGMLETIEAFAQLGRKPRRTILFALFDSEEKGLLGSKHWVASPTVPLNQVALAINMDMIGRLRNQKLKVFGTRTSSGLRRLVSQCNRHSSLDLDFTWELKANSDHHSFFASSIPVLMLHTGLHDDYHRPSDDAHKVNAKGMQQVSQLLFQLALELGDRDAINGFRSASRQETPYSKQRFEQPLSRAPSRFGVRWKREEGIEGGYFLTYVADGSAADRAGLRRGDRLLRFGNRDIKDQRRLIIDILAASKPVKTLVKRAGEEKPREVTVELAGKPIRVGISWREDPAEPGTVMLIRVVPGSAADLAGLKVRDRVYGVAGKSFRDGKELLKVLNAAEGKLSVLIERRGRLETVQLELPPVAGGSLGASPGGASPGAKS